MTDRYVNPAVGSSGAGTSWATAYKTLAEATAAAAAGETIYFANGTANTYTTNPTYTLAAGVKVISTSDTTNNPPTTYATGAKVTSVTFGVEYTIAGTGAFYGVIFESANDGTTTPSIGTTNGAALYFEDCTFATKGSSGQLWLGTDITSVKSEIRTKNCTFTASNTAHSIKVCSVRWESCGDTFFATGTIPTLIFDATSQRCSANVKISGANLSACNTTLVSSGSAQPGCFEFSSCLLHASATYINALALGGCEIFMFDCSYDAAGTLTGPLLYHEDYFGSTTISTAIYANAGATYDGTLHCSWVVDGKTTSSMSQPYYSPWIDVYNGEIATSITPNLECVRSGSSTAYTDGEIWAEFAYRNTANSPRLEIAQDRRLPLTAAANQETGALGASDWTGENATSWFGKLSAPAAFTPDEVGYMRARICVAGDLTVYVDPKIRGLA